MDQNLTRFLLLFSRYAILTAAGMVRRQDVDITKTRFQSVLGLELQASAAVLQITAIAMPAMAHASHGELTSGENEMVKSMSESNEKSRGCGHNQGAVISDGSSGAVANGPKGEEAPTVSYGGEIKARCETICQLEYEK